MSPRTPHPARVLLAGSLSGALCAALANVAVSALVHPVAFREPGGWIAPLAATFPLFAACLLPASFAACQLLGRRGLTPALASLGIGVFATLVGSLSPVTLVLARDLTTGGSLVVAALGLVASVGMASVAVLMAARRRAGGAVRGLAWGAPVAAALVLALLLWLTGSGSSAPAVPPLPDVASAGVAALADEAPRVVVLFTVDTLRADFANGGGFAERASTPAIAGLMADSVVFENARSPAPWTKPAMASLLTGLSPLVHGASSYGGVLPETLETLAETLSAAGYTTAAVGYNDHLDAAFAFDQGFDHYAFPARGDVGLSFGALLLSRLRPARYPARFVSTDGIAQVAVDWIRRNHTRPFFLWVHVLDPHVPYAPPAHLLPVEGPGVWGNERTVTWVQAGVLRLDEGKREQIRNLYRAEVRYADEAVGQVLDALKAHGLYEGALIAFTSDHGEEFWEHGGFEHGHSLYDEVLRVPLAFKLPGSARRGRVQAPVSTESLTPTLVDLLGRGADGRYTSPSLAGPLLAEDVDTDGAPLFASGTFYHGEKRMVLLRGRYKLVLDLETGSKQLFDLLADPGERESISAARPDLMAEAGEALRRRVTEAGEIGRSLGVDAPERTALDPGMRARLRALGYLGAEE